MRFSTIEDFPDFEKRVKAMNLNFKDAVNEGYIVQIMGKLYLSGKMTFMEVGRVTGNEVVELYGKRRLVNVAPYLRKIGKLVNGIGYKKIKYCK